MKLLTKRHLPEAGFTLLEVLVSVTLIAVMAVGLYALLRISLRSWSKGTEFIDANQSHRSMMDSVQKQISSAYPLNSPPDPDLGNATYPIFSGDENNLQFLSLNSLSFLENPGLTFVSYELTQDNNGRYLLIERETPYTGQLPEQTTIDQVRVTSVFNNLTDFAFEYFDKGDANNSPQWVSEWNPQTTPRFPAAVAMTMVSIDSQGHSVERRIVAPISTELKKATGPSGS
jgi:prepilin-type N-terminal cleavage/methylation domain-containing protein